MKSKVETKKEMNKNFDNHVGAQFYLTIDKESKEKVSLKNLLKAKLFGAVCTHGLNIQLVIAQDIHVDLVDDLIDFDITCSKLEIVLNKKSSIHYNLKMLQHDRVMKTDDGLMVSDISNGCVDKELDFKFVGQHAFAKIRCCCSGTNDAIFNLKTMQHHQASFTKSDILIKGAFLKKSKFLCDSLIKVDKGLKQIEAVHLNKNLLIGCKSKAISIPKLEVKSDDVACKHGATMSQLDDNHIFYMQSRGIDFCKTKEILVHSFLN